MRVICLLCDSLNRHFLKTYGSGLAETPNIDWLASKAHVFDRHFSGSLPTMPTRRELWTGNYEFLWRPWGALEPWDRDLPSILRDSGILTMLITDSYHLFERGSGNYHVDFEGWEFFRGFENDPWVTEPTEAPEFKGQLKDRYVRNMLRMENEEDLPPVKTLRCVERWLRRNNTRENFFLMIDEFAPHEPFNTPDYLVKKYDPDYKGPLLFWPKYGKDMHDERELQHLRATYAAHVTLVDKYIGHVFETMSDLDMWKDTAFILMTDHGHFLGDHGFTGKPQCPQYDTLAHIPLMIYVPGLDGNATRVDALTANIDLFPTILELFGRKPEVPVHGRTLLPVMKGEANQVRDWNLYGYFGRFVNITDGHRTYFRAPRQDNGELNVYSLRWEFPKRYCPTGLNDTLELGRFMRDVPIAVGKLRIDAREVLEGTFEVCNHLYDLDEDPGQEKNLAGTDQENSYVDLLKEALETVDCPQEQYRRLEL